ncbi:hypothetical protein CDV31_008661 [Fusarium ambrosium]|uniref:AB hydrolase-1 domain-containing protein n=1 Tax=Fusarium ambrosium TaxID=131363 RepID=A0A428TZ70_9HYPO|nr:hypothetical protein CDV31_008661 [Fusarium ambrosium]
MMGALQTLALAGYTLTAMAASGTPTLPDPILVDIVPVGGIVGSLQRPAPGGDAAKASIAVMVMHAEQDYMSFSACTELPKRGYTVFCVNNAASKTGYMSDLNFEDMMTNAAYAVRYLRNMTEVNKVILFGHSGGGAMLSQYQNIAENGVSACAGPEKIYPCSEAMADLPAADGVLLNDANFGIGVMTVLSMNPAIEDESSGMHINQDLNLYSVANGFNSSGPSRYTKAFAQRFAQGVHARNSRIIKFAKERLVAINNGSGLFDDDEPLYLPDAIYVGNNNKFFSQDLDYLRQTSQPWKLLHANGSSTVQIIPSVRVASTTGSIASKYLQGALKTTVKRFLSTMAVTTTEDLGYQADGLTGFVWNSSQMVPMNAVKGIRAPLLTMGNTGHYEFVNIEKTHLAAISNDTDIVFVEGAEHSIQTCTECESYPGEFGDTVKTTFDYIDKWLSKSGRFI